MSNVILEEVHYSTGIEQRLANRAYHKRFEFEIYNKKGILVKVCTRKERAVMFCDNSDGFTFKRIEK